MNKTLVLSLAGIFTALYAGGVIILAPISFGVIQVRVIDCIIPLSSIFGLPVVFGVSAGNIVANIYGGLGVIDIAGGTIANLLASLTVYAIKKQTTQENNQVIITVLSNILAAFIITAIVGGYLSVIFSVPIEISIIGVLIGSIISVTLLGSVITIALEKSGFKQI